jgi:hypothetical protein
MFNTAQSRHWSSNRVVGVMRSVLAIVTGGSDDRHVGGIHIWRVRIRERELGAASPHLADASLHQLDTRGARFGVQATAWVRSVTVRDPASGATVVKQSSSTVPMRFEDNAVGVTFSINTTAGVQAEGLLHVFGWP